MLKADQILPATRDALIQGGWAEDRQINMDATVALYRSHGFEITNSLLAIFSNLSGIRAAALGRWVDFSPEPALSLVSREDLQLFEHATGERQCPFGSASCAYLFLGIPGTAFFLDSDWLLFHAFQDVAALCDCILAGDNNSIQFSRQLTLDERPPDLR
jgi:hypothetical protein